MTEKRDTSKRRVMALTEDLAKALTDYRVARGHKSQAAAVRALIKRGLEELQVPNNTKARSLPIEPQ